MCTLTDDEKQQILQYANLNEQCNITVEMLEYQITQLIPPENGTISEQEREFLNTEVVSMEKQIEGMKAVGLVKTMEDEYIFLFEKEISEKDKEFAIRNMRLKIAQDNIESGLHKALTDSLDFFNNESQYTIN